jgi:hypothetical protein
VCRLLSSIVRSLLVKNGFASSPVPAPRKDTSSEGLTKFLPPRKKRRLDLNGKGTLCRSSDGTPTPSHSPSASDSKDKSINITVVCMVQLLNCSADRRDYHRILRLSITKRDCGLTLRAVKLIWAIEGWEIHV